MCFSIACSSSLIIAGFSDGKIRIYEIIENSELGSFHLNPELPKPITSLSLLPNKRNALAGDTIGRIFIFRLISHKPLKTEIALLIENRARIWNCSFYPYEPLKLWGMTCRGRTIKIWKRQDIYRVHTEEENEAKLEQVSELEYYLIDNFTLKEGVDPRSEEKYTKFEFSTVEPNTVLIITSGSLQVFFRNFLEHLVIFF